METGAMSQVIQGNNLRCLYADAQTSLLQAPRYPHAFYSQHNGGHSSLLGTGEYGQSPARMPTSSGSVTGRDEIIFVSDDRVLKLRMAAVPRQ